MIIFLLLLFLFCILSLFSFYTLFRLRNIYKCSPLTFLLLYYFILLFSLYALYFYALSICPVHLLDLYFSILSYGLSLHLN